MANELVQLKDGGNNLFPKSDSVERITLTNIHPDASSSKYFGWHNRSTGLCVLIFSIESSVAISPGTVLAKIPSGLEPISEIYGLTSSFNKQERLTPSLAVGSILISTSGSILQYQTNSFTGATSIFVWTVGMS